jgi:hypothetical protein
MAAALLGFAWPAAADATSRFKVDVDETGGRVVVTYAPKQRMVEQKIRLNGFPLEDRFASAQPTGQPLVVGLDEGLRFGQNTLLVRALYADGKVVKRVRNFRIEDDHPLAGITGDNHLHDGIPMLLRARTAPPGASRSERQEFNRHQGDVRLRWTILDRPDGAEATLRKRHAERPRFVPDQPGIYRIGLTATRNGGGSAKAGAGASRTDEETLLVESSEASKAGVFIGEEPLDATTIGDPTAVRVFSGSLEGSYPIGSNNGEAGPIVNLLVDSCTLTPVDSSQFTNPLYMGSDDVATLIDATAAALQELASSGCSLMVITAGAGYGQIGPLGPVLDKWTDPPNPNFGADPAMSAPFWAIYTLTADEGHGVANFPYFDGTTPSGRMAGELLKAPSGTYVFRPSTVPAYGSNHADLRFSMNENGITTPVTPPNGGEQALSPAGTPGCPQNGNGGFELLVLYADGPYALESVGIGTAQVNGQTVGNGFTFWVNGCTQQDGEAWAKALAQVMGSIGTNFNDVPVLIFLQGVGNALPAQSAMTAAENQALQQVAAKIGDMGGSPGAFLNDGNATIAPARSGSGASAPGYAFVGQSWPLPGGARSGAEVTTATPGNPPAQLDGFVKPDQLSRLAPSVATPVIAALGPDFDDYRATQSASALVNPDADFAPEAFPGAGNQEWEAAMYYLSKNIFDPVLTYDPTDACYAPKMDQHWVVYDVRSMYCGGGGGDGGSPWDAYYAKITTLETKPEDGYVSGQGFSQGTWTQVLAQLQTEFQMVENLNRNTRAFQRAYGLAGNDGWVAADEMVTAVNTYINKKLADADKIEPLVGDSLEIIASISNLVAVGYSVKGNYDSSNVAWGVQGVIDLLDSMGTLGIQVADTILKPLPANTTATGYASILENGLQEASATLAIPRDQIASDWTRLQTYNKSGLDLQSGDVKAASVGLAYGTYDRIWRQLLPSSFLPAHLTVNDYAGNPPYTGQSGVWNYSCVWGYSDRDGYLTEQPFQDFPANSYTAYPEGPTSQNPSGVEAYVLAGSDFSSDLLGTQYNPIPPPDQEIMSQLFSVPPDPGASYPPDPPVPAPPATGPATALGINKHQFFADVLESARAANPSQILEVATGDEGHCPTN